MTVSDKEMGDAELDRRLEALPRSADQAPDLWPGIKHRLEQRQRRAYRVWPAVAALVLASVIVLVLQNGPDQVDPRPLVSDPPTAFDGGRVSAESEVLRASNLLLAGLDGPGMPGRAGELSGAPGWREHRAAVDELERALAGEPDNPLLLELMTTARLRELTLADQLWRMES